MYNTSNVNYLFLLYDPFHPKGCVDRCGGGEGREGERYYNKNIRMTTVTITSIYMLFC